MDNSVYQLRQLRRCLARRLCHAGRWLCTIHSFNDGADHGEIGNCSRQLFEILARDDDASSTGQVGFQAGIQTIPTAVDRGRYPTARPLPLQVRFRRFADD